jgi:hypothetical protein
MRDLQTNQLIGIVFERPFVNLAVEFRHSTLRDEFTET